MNRDRDHKIIITGTGRAGTTFLVRLLTELGLDTGYTPSQWRNAYNEHCQAGLEFDLKGPDAPRIIKDPHLCETLPGLLAEGRFAVDHAIIPMRDLDSAARSRIAIGGGSDRVPGGLWGTSNPAEQRSVLAERFHLLAHTLTVYEIPHTFILFPRLVQDPDYLYKKLGFLLDGIDRETFVEVFNRIADTRLVHTFDQRASIPADVSMTPAALAYTGVKRRRSWQRWIRRSRRALTFAASLAAVVSVQKMGWLNFSWVPAIGTGALFSREHPAPPSGEYTPDDDPVAVAPPEVGAGRIGTRRFDRELVDAVFLDYDRRSVFSTAYRRPLAANPHRLGRSSSLRPIVFIDPFQAMKSFSGPEVPQ